VSLSLSVSKQDDSKRYEQVAMDFVVRVRHGPRGKGLDFGRHPLFCGFWDI